ncbi:MAG: 30S ribosomal protein S6 [Nitrospinota bacterium]|nr:30S ribosomal protein S6 [Nitrospinota bacterium]
MRTYQTVLILKPDIDDAKVDQVNDKVAKYVSQDGGSILRTDKWGKKRLAYKVKKNRFGIYLNIFHTCNQGKIDGLEKEFWLDESIIKYMVVRLDSRELDRVFAEKSATTLDDIDETVREDSDK